MGKTRAPLTREQILEAALALLDSEGLAALSMRKVAAVVGVEAMSLYNHITDKRDLLNGLADLVLTRITLPDPTKPWDVRLEAIAIGLYEALIAHPALVAILASEQGRPTDLRVLQGMDSILAALAESGLSPAHQVNAYRGLLALCLGFVLTHTQGLTVSASEAQAEWARSGVQPWDPQMLPHLARLGPQFLKTPAESDFRFMLAAYVTALRAATRKPSGRVRERARRR